MLVKKIWSKLKEFWKDPVWSKVISAAIIGLAIYIYNSLKNGFHGLSFQDKAITFLQDYLFVLLIILLVFIIFRIAFKKKKKEIAFKEIALIEKCKRHKNFKMFFYNNCRASDIKLRQYQHLPDYTNLLTQLHKDKMIDIGTQKSPSLNDLGKKILDNI